MFLCWNLHVVFTFSFEEGRYQALWESNPEVIKAEESFGNEGRLASPHTRKSRNHKLTQMCRKDRSEAMEVESLNASWGGSGDHHQSLMLWKWSHGHPQPAWDAVFSLFRSGLHWEIAAWRTEHIPVDCLLLFFLKNETHVYNSQARELTLFF